MLRVKLTDRSVELLLFATLGFGEDTAKVAATAISRSQNEATIRVIKFG